MPRPSVATSVRWVVPVLVLGLLAVLVGVLALARPDRLAVERGTPYGDRGPPPPTRVEEPATTLSPRPVCDRVARAFVPEEIGVPGVTRGAAVVTPARDAAGIPGVPPLTTAGKSVFAWDRAHGTMPGGTTGNVLLNAHTWPDGSALGNRLLAALHVGDRLVVRGAEGRLCYRVTERVEVSADAGMYRYYDKVGPPQLAILVCSGTRVAPGVWTRRTVWFASPVTADPSVP